MKSLQLRIHVAVEAILDCKSPATMEDDEGLLIRIEEVRDFEDRMRKTADRLYNSLGSICYNVQAFGRVIRDLITMSQDLNLFPLKLWKVDGQEPEYDRQQMICSTYNRRILEDRTLAKSSSRYVSGLLCGAVSRIATSFSRCLISLVLLKEISTWLKHIIGMLSEGLRYFFRIQ